MHVERCYFIQFLKTVKAFLHLNFVSCLSLWQQGLAAQLSCFNKISGHPASVSWCPFSVANHAEAFVR